MGRNRVRPMARRGRAMNSPPSGQDGRDNSEPACFVPARPVETPAMRLLAALTLLALAACANNGDIPDSRPSRGVYLNGMTGANFGVTR